MKPNKPEEEEEEVSNMKEPHQKQSRRCDYCNASTALIYCRADSAKLCFTCDKEVHSTNQLFTKHCRSQLCDACDNSPASVFCETEHSVLCQNCDWERHSYSRGSSGGSSVHSRRPIEGFSGCPSVNELLLILGFDDLSDKALILSEKSDRHGDDNLGFDGLSSGLALWETPEFVNLNDLIVSSGSGHNFRAMEVPPLPKNRNAVCGKHKEEMLRQLCELAKSEPGLSCENSNIEPDIGLQFHVPEQNFSQEDMYAGNEHDTNNISFPISEVNELNWLGDNCVAAEEDFLQQCFGEGKSLVSDKVLDINGGMNHANNGEDGNSQVPITTWTLPRLELNSQERDYALSRYKEKKKTRRYDKHIRYESRKVRAESRTRIRGRFAKIN